MKRLWLNMLGKCGSAVYAIGVSFEKVGAYFHKKLERLGEYTQGYGFKLYCYGNSEKMSAARVLANMMDSRVHDIYPFVPQIKRGGCEVQDGCFRRADCAGDAHIYSSGEDRENADSRPLAEILKDKRDEVAQQFSGGLLTQEEANVMIQALDECEVMHKESQKFWNKQRMQLEQMKAEVEKQIEKDKTKESK